MASDLPHPAPRDALEGVRGLKGVSKGGCKSRDWQLEKRLRGNAGAKRLEDCWRRREAVDTADGHSKGSPPLCDIPSGCCSFTGPWTVTRSSLRMLRRVAAFCPPLRPVLLLVSFPRSRSPVVGVLGLC